MSVADSSDAAKLASLREVASSFWRHAGGLRADTLRALAAGWEIFAGAICKAENGNFPPTESELEMARLRSRGPAQPVFTPRCQSCGVECREPRCPRCVARDVETAALLARLIACDARQSREVRAAAAAYSASVLGEVLP